MRAVAVIIFSEDKERILLSKRSTNKENESGRWENVGGKVEANETFEEAVIRETKEELGVLVTEMKEKLVYGDKLSESCVIVYEVKIKGDPQIMEPFFCNEIRWFNIKELGSVNVASYTKEDFIKLGWI